MTGAYNRFYREKEQGMASDIVKHDESLISGLPAGYEQAGSLAVSLARAEVDQQIATARALPRSISKAVKNIMDLATLDEESAEECIYALPRGGKPIKGPSIRLAEIIGSQWGNCRIGARVVHVDRYEKFVEAEGIFHDLETNTATTARVRRRISTKQGKLFDDDMIVVTGNAACAIAKRNAILGSVPKAVWRKAYAAVEHVIMGDVKTLSERRGKAIAAFGGVGVTPDQIFAALGVAGEDDVGLEELATLTAMRAALKNGEATVEELFTKPEAKGQAVKGLGNKLDAIAAAGADPETGEIKQEAPEPSLQVVEAYYEKKGTGAGRESAPEAAAGEAGEKPATDTNASDTAAADKKGAAIDAPQGEAGDAAGHQPATASPAPKEQDGDELFAAGLAAAQAGKSRKNAPLNVRNDEPALARWQAGYDSHGKQF